MYCPVYPSDRTTVPGRLFFRIFISTFLRCRTIARTMSPLFILPHHSTIEHWPVWNARRMAETARQFPLRRVSAFYLFGSRPKWLFDGADRLYKTPETVGKIERREPLGIDVKLFYFTSTFDLIQAPISSPRTF